MENSLERLVSVGLAVLLWTVSGAALANGCLAPRGTGDLGIVVERAAGSVLVVDTTHHRRLARVEHLGDLSHASAVYSRDGRYAFVFGRDGGLTKIDLLCARIERRVVQAGNSIGGAISQDGSLVAVSNYDPGGVRIFDTRTLELVADIAAVASASAVLGGHEQRSKVVGLVDAPGQRFVFSLFDAGEIWVVEVGAERGTRIHKFTAVGEKPYDALITPDGRYYLAGLFGEDGMAMLDLWHLERGVTRVLDGYGRGERTLPVYKMPHLEGWAMADGSAFVPAVGRHEVLVIDRRTWTEQGRIPVAGQPVFVMARPDGRKVWVTFAFPDNSTVQVIDVESLEIERTLQPGKAVLHMEFSPRGEQVWLSIRDDDRVEVYDTWTYQRIADLPADKPSGIFFTARAHRIGL